MSNLLTERILHMHSSSYLPKKQTKKEMVGSSSIVLALVMIQIHASPTRERNRLSVHSSPSLKCGEQRFHWMKGARTTDDKKWRMLFNARCEDDKNYDHIFDHHFERLNTGKLDIAVCERLRKNCDWQDPRSHRYNDTPFDTNSKCFENWFGSFDDKCKKRLENATTHVSEDSIDVKIIEDHKMCLKQHLDRYVMKRHVIQTLIDILEDRIHYANHCYSFV